MNQLRRRFCLTLIVVLLCAATIGASAAYYNKDSTLTNFEKNYKNHWYDSAVYCGYTVGGWLTDASASTALSVSNDADGYAEVVITALNGTSYKAYSLQASSGWINSGSAVGKGSDYAKKVVHYCERTVSGVTDHWTITYT